MANLSQVVVPNGTTYNINSKKTYGIPYAEVDSTSTNTAYTATVEGITEYYDGVCVLLRNGQVTSAAGFTIDINGLGAKRVFNNMAAGKDRAVPPTTASYDTTIFNEAYTMLFIYSTALDNGNGGWWCYRGYNSDNNTIGYQLRTNSTILKTSGRSRYYRLFFTSADNTHWVPANTAVDNSAVSKKVVNQTAINPFGRIIYFSANTNMAAEANVGAAYCWEQYVFGLGYSFNPSGTTLALTTNTPVYIKCAPQSNGSAIIDANTPFVQALPTSQDDKIYIYLGVANSATSVELYQDHPVYHYKSGHIQLWSNAIPTSVSQLTNDAGYVTSADLTKVMTYQGTVATTANLPTSHKQGDVWHVNSNGSEWAWNGSAWQEIGRATSVSTTKGTVSSASTGTAISADDITDWTTNTPTKVSFNNVVTSGSTTSVKPITKKTVVTSVTTANVVTGGSTSTITPVTAKTVVTGVSSTKSVTPITKKTVVTSVTPATVVTGGSTSSIKPITKKTVVTGATAANVVTGWSTGSITPVTKKTVVTGGTTSEIPNISKKTVVVSGSASTFKPITKKTVVTGGTTSEIPNISKKTVVVGATASTFKPVTKKTVVTGVTASNVVTSATMPTATYSSGILTFTTGSVSTGAAASVTTGDSVTEGSATTYLSNFSTGDSVTVGTAFKAYTGLTTGDSVTEGSATTFISSLTTGDSVTVGTAFKAYTGLTTGDSVTVGTAQTVITSCTTGASASFNTGDSVTEGTSMAVYTGLNTGAAATVQTGDSVTEGTSFSVVASVNTGDSVNNGTAATVVTGLTKGPSATVQTGDSVTEGTTYSVIASLSTGVAGASTNGTSASLSYTPKSIPNVTSLTPTTVVTEVAPVY